MATQALFPKEKLEQILIAMIATSRNLNLYPKEHPLVVSQVSKLVADINGMFTSQDKLSVAVVEAGRVGDIRLSGADGS